MTNDISKLHLLQAASLQLAIIVCPMSYMVSILKLRAKEFLRAVIEFLDSLDELVY
jgi:hypothetical protein